MLTSVFILAFSVILCAWPVLAVAQHMECDDRAKTVKVLRSLTYAAIKAAHLSAEQEVELYRLVKQKAGTGSWDIEFYVIAVEHLAAAGVDTKALCQALASSKQ